ncbi:MAG: FeoA family protein [Bryobacteraceae bacterium]|jgi:ferrous iron transport protein A
MMQLSGRKPAARSRRSLEDLSPGEEGVLDRLDLPKDVARRLMELGFLPGQRITRAMAAPGGDPRVFRVDGSEIALRRETASRLRLRDQPAPIAQDIASVPLSA